MHRLKKLKFKSKPWITLGLQKSISVKNKLLANFINKKYPILKEKLINILKEIGIILRTHGKGSNLLFL